jgi:SSS family solute:Na+ symporter
MSAPVIALAIAGVVVLATIATALLAVRRLPSDPTQLVVGGRSLGAVLLWILLAGEVYTSFTFLGAAGWAYSYGAPAFYILAYGTCGYILGYFLLPAIRRAGAEGGFLTGPDYFAGTYGSNGLGMLVALVQAALVIPYVTLQLTGLQIIIRDAGYGRVEGTVAASIAFIVIAAFVFTAGLRGTAWASLVKDALVLVAVLFAGIAIPTRFFGSPAGLFTHLLAAHRAMLTIPGGAAPHGMNWFISTVLLSAIGFYTGPHSIAAAYAARSDDALRRNAIYLPVYQLVLLLMFFAGFSALLLAPGLHGPAADQSFLLVVRTYYPAWIMGIVAGAGALAALLPASALLLAAGSVVTKNLIPQYFARLGDATRQTAAIRGAILGIAVLALILWLTAKTTLVELLLVYYAGMTQLAPGLILGALRMRTDATAIACGILAGLAGAIYWSLPGRAPWGVNGGFAALALNLAVIALVTTARARRGRGGLS